MDSSRSAEQAISAWKQTLGAEAVKADEASLRHYSESVCAYQRSIIAVLQPASLEEVQQVVKVANQYRVPLYPVSCGKQWGMGSMLPVQDGAAIVELKRMNRIIDVNPQFHYAVVEPGVTQQQLLEYLKEHNLPLMLNVTGSTSDTSLIGNCMDRGVGYFSSRAESISNMEIVLGSGETIRTGFGHYKKAKTDTLYRHGVGPSIDGLFVQANFGIVTSACIDLMPRPSAHMAAVIRIDAEEKLPQLIDALVRLRAQGIIQTVAHVGNRERSVITLAPLLYQQLLKAGDPPGAATREKAEALLQAEGFGPWSAAVPLIGTPRQIKLAKQEIRRAVSGFARPLFLTDSLIEKARALGRRLAFIPWVRHQLMMLETVDPVYRFTRGDSSNESLKSVYWAAGDFDALDKPNPDHSDSGVLYCLPIIPADGQTVGEVVRDTAETFSRYGFQAAITVNLMDTKAMEGVVSLGFNRTDSAQVEKAHACIQEMEARYMEQGYPPYRVGINSMHHIVTPDDTFWQTTLRLKQALDPNGIIAPGRYNLI